MKTMITKMKFNIASWLFNQGYLQKIKFKIMKDILGDFKKNVFMDEVNANICKEHYKEDGFKDNVYFSVEKKELDEKSFQECLDRIKPFLSNEKLIICNIPIVRYETNAYSVDEDNTLEKIVNHLDKNNIVLLYRPILNNGVLNFKSRLL